jgi:hypothetical protein
MTADVAGFVACATRLTASRYPAASCTTPTRPTARHHTGGPSNGRASGAPDEWSRRQSAKSERLPGIEQHQ